MQGGGSRPDPCGCKMGRTGLGQGCLMGLPLPQDQGQPWKPLPWGTWGRKQVLGDQDHEEMGWSGVAALRRDLIPAALGFRTMVHGLTPSPAPEMRQPTGPGHGWK